MGIYSNGKIYGISWRNIENDEEYITELSEEALTNEQREKIYSDFKNIHSFSVYTRGYTTYGPSPTCCCMWFPLELRYIIEYFETGSIKGF